MATGCSQLRDKRDQARHKTDQKIDSAASDEVCGRLTREEVLKGGEKEEK